jgi:hypothetical protein
VSPGASAAAIRRAAFSASALPNPSSSSSDGSTVATRASKALRFGLDEVQSGQPFSNAERLGHEAGDVIEMVEHLIARGLILREDIEHGRASKRRKLMIGQQEAGVSPPAGPTAAPVVAAPVAVAAAG